jgi:hypothetical protein
MFAGDDDYHDDREYDHDNRGDDDHDRGDDEYFGVTRELDEHDIDNDLAVDDRVEYLGRPSGLDRGAVVDDLARHGRTRCYFDVGVGAHEREHRHGCPALHRQLGVWSHCRPLVTDGRRTRARLRPTPTPDAIVLDGSAWHKSVAQHERAQTTLQTVSTTAGLLVGEFVPHLA